MNLTKLTAPDFPLGKLLCLIRTTVDLVLLLLLNTLPRPWRALRLIWTLTPRYTMVKGSRLITMYRLATEVGLRKVPGDIVECGVWNGGSAAVLASACRDSSTPSSPRRRVWLFDSFQGLPPPGERDGAVERKDYFHGWNHGSPTKVREAFRRVRAPLENVCMIAGWFENTLPRNEVQAIALLHIDADWYDSVKTVLQSLYPKVAPEGFIVLDDYGMWEGCRRALEDYFKENRIPEPKIIRMGLKGAYFNKSRAS